jgi:hypothetical protein
MILPKKCRQFCPSALRGKFLPPIKQWLLKLLSLFAINAAKLHPSYRMNFQNQRKIVRVWEGCAVVKQPLRDSMDSKSETARHQQIYSQNLRRSLQA